MSDAVDLIQSRLKTVRDFPKPGVLFRDLTPVFAHGPSFRAVVDALIEPFVGNFDAVAGLEARGFLLAAAAAIDAGVGVLPIRKEGKLPGETLTERYALEYGEAAFEVSPDALPPGARVLVMDDVLATGGTIGASVALIERAGWHVAGISVVMEILELDGRARLDGRAIHAIVEV